MNERRKRSRSSGTGSYDGRIAADIPIRPLRMSSTDLATFAAAISGLARSIRRVADGYDQASEAELGYIKEKITRGVRHIADLWEAMQK